MVFPVLVLDSSFLISLYAVSDCNHHKAVQKFRSSGGESLLLPAIILDETLTVLNYKEGIDAARLAYEKLSDNQGIRVYELSPAEKAGVLDLFFRLKKLSVADASVVYLSKKFGAQALCYDRQILSKIKD